MLYNIKTFILLSLVLISLNGYAVPSGIKVLSDISYGKDADQTLDVYIPADAKDAPVIFMIHGGAWSGGDKAIKAEFENKVAHWVTRGFIFISTNYRTLPKIGPIGQAKDVEAALLVAQQRVGEWGGSPEKFILMGHSAGAHLVSLISSNYSTITGNEIIPWLGTVSMDTSTYDVVKRLTSQKDSEFYKERFGENPDYWQKASPFYALNDKLPPFLAVCSRRSDDACIESKNFIKKAKDLGTHVEILAVDLSHGEINSELGKGSCYTSNVDDFLKTLSPEIASMFTSQDSRMKKNCAGDRGVNGA
ncbi:alpha/beta hydrolase [Thalassotalea fonticola]|uniref:Alpha/beta hydrolase n=1 Tax=Thalassotalea fonticola TaxID=3065649 RepID=A0ABZ0GLC6_9GAMM|nr:alpha/beta hydrolase [Colwelliaceae bacterium S1-1]